MESLGRDGFMNLPDAISDYEKAKVVVMPFGAGSDCIWVPGEIISVSQRIFRYGDRLSCDPFAGIGVATVKEPGSMVPGTLFPRSLSSISEEFITNLKRIIGSEKIPITIGANEHILTVEFAKALKEKYEKVRLVRFDAHLTLGDDGGKYLDRQSVMGRVNPLVEDIFIIGVRGAAEKDIVALRAEKGKTKEGRVTCKRMREHIRRMDGGIRTTARNLESWLRGGKNAFVSFDIDVLDSSVVGSLADSPEPGGFHYDEILDIFDEFLPKSRIVGANFVGFGRNAQQGPPFYTVAKLISAFVARLAV